MHRILVPLGSNPAQAEKQIKAITLLPLRTEETRVLLTHILRDDSLDAPKEMQNPERVSTVIDAKEELEKSGHQVEIYTTEAPPDEGILRLADEVEADHIIIGGRKRSPTGKALFGSTTQSIILNSEVPVTVVPENSL